MDCCHHVVRLVQHLDIREPQDVKALVEQEGIAPPVVINLLAVLAAIDLDDEPGRDTGEVTDVWTDAVLTPELEAGQLPVAQSIPEPMLGRGRPASHRAGMMEHALRDGERRYRVTAA